MFTNGSAITIGDVPRRPAPDRVRRNEVAENWQLVCANNAARLPPQRLVGDEQRIASCLERCSQRLMKPSGKDPTKSKIQWETDIVTTLGQG